MCCETEVLLLNKGKLDAVADREWEAGRQKRGAVLWVKGVCDCKRGR